MRRYFLSFLLIILCTGFIYSQEEINTASSEFNNIFQFSIGSGYSFYFPIIDSAVDTMDSGSLVRFPVSLDFLYGKKISMGCLANSGN